MWECFTCTDKCVFNFSNEKYQMYFWPGLFISKQTMIILKSQIHRNKGIEKKSSYMRQKQQTSNLYQGKESHKAKIQPAPIMHINNVNVQ